MSQKLVEVALPLDAISKACRTDKDRKTGTTKNVHKWFAPMPTPAWRALLFAALIDVPDSADERGRLLDLVRRLVDTDGAPPSDRVLAEARAEIARQGNSPIVFDPFCGGGSTLIEAQRLGLPAVGTDLNPVPVLISKVLCEIIPSVSGAAGLKETSLSGLGHPLDGFLGDLRHYGEEVRKVAETQVGAFFPTIGVDRPLAWLWARTVICPNPACRATIPLYSSPWVSKQKGAERWLNPVIEGGAIHFEIGHGKASPPPATKVGVRGARFRCLVCSEVAPEEHIRAEGKSGGMGVQLLAVATDGPRGRDYKPASDAQVRAALVGRPDDYPEVALPERALGFRVQAYGMTSQADLYTDRQLQAMTAFADAVAQAPAWVRADGGTEEYSRAITSVLGLCLGKLAQANSTQVRWFIDPRNGSGKAVQGFGRHALPMVWDFTETNPFAGSVGGWMGQIDSVSGGLRALPAGVKPAKVEQHDARTAGATIAPGSALIATDPPYFGQIGYADLSDYFYVWHRRALKGLYPELYGTITTPKKEELIATPYRHGGDSDAAYEYFVSGFTDTFRQLAKASRPDLPMLVIYAHRQEESQGEGLTSSAWDAMLEALLAAGLGLVGTWPIHATHSSRQIGLGTNSLASYTVLVCRKRAVDAGITDRQGFLRALRTELPTALRVLQEASTLPFDLTQAAIGPGMAIFSRFARIVEPSGDAMRVRTALGLINQVRSEVLTSQDDVFDAETRWAVQWFERFGFDEGPFGEAEKLFTAMATSLEGVRRAGIVATRAPNVWLIGPGDLSGEWDPVADKRVSVWEITVHLLRSLESGGEGAAADLLAKVGGLGDQSRDLAYRLADICERNRWAKLALSINGLVASWPEISRRAAEVATAPSQPALF